MPQQPKPKTIYTRGADDGLWMGLYISAAMALIVGSIYMTALQIPSIVVALGVPFLTYFFLRRTHVAAHGMTVFSALWMQGIVMFACASIVFGGVAFVYLRFVNPDFIHELLVYLASFYDSVDDANAKAIGDELRMIVDSNAAPRPAVLVLGEMWSVMFSGSLLSMLVSFIVRIKRVPVSGIPK